MKRIAVLFLVLILPTFSWNLYPKERRGAELVITKTDNQQIAGELIAVSPTSLLLLDSQSGVDVSVAVEDVKAITIVKKSKALLGVGLGLLAGLVGGLIIGGSEKFIEGTRLEAIALYAGAIGGPAALIGGIVGLAIGADKLIQIEGKSPEEIKAILEKLRSKSRIREVQ